MVGKRVARRRHEQGARGRVIGQLEESELWDIWWNFIFGRCDLGVGFVLWTVNDPTPHDTMV